LRPRVRVASQEPASRASVESGKASVAEAERRHSLKPNSDAYLQELRKEFPFQGFIDGAEYRAITLRQLLRVTSFASRWATQEAGQRQWSELQEQEGTPQPSGRMLTMGMVNFYHLNTWLLRPATQARSQQAPFDCSFVELLTSERQTPKWFISHWWGERVTGFVKCIELQAKTREFSDSTGFWVCAFAHRQHSLGEDLPQDPMMLPVGKAMELSDGMLLVLSHKNDSSHTAPFHRLWCLMEEYLLITGSWGRRLMLDIATTHGIEAQILTDGLTEREQRLEDKRSGEGSRCKMERESTFPIEVVEEGLNLNVESAKASLDSDRAYILNVFANRDRSQQPLANHPNYARVTSRLRATFAVAVWRQALERNTVESMRLAEVLQADIGRVELRLDMALSTVSSIGFATVVKGIPPKLRRLQISFQDCDQIDDGCLAMLANRLPHVLEELDLNFELCERVGDPGLAALAMALPDGLQGIRLNFTACSEVGDPGLAALAQGLPMGLQRADLRFTECAKVSDNGLAAFAQTNSVVLRRLRLDFRRCDHVTSAGLAVLAQSGGDRVAEDVRRDGLLTDLHMPGKESQQGRKLVLHFALPRTLMTCDMAAHRSTEAELNSVLTELAWGRALKEGWELVSPEPSVETVDPTLCSYADFLRRIYPTDHQKVEGMQTVFTNPNEPGQRLRPFFDKMLKALSYSNNWLLAKAYDIKKVVLNEEEVPEDSNEPEQAIMRLGRHQVLPSFWQLLIHLTKRERNFSIVLRSFSAKQLSIMQRELQFFCKGLHPAYSGQNKTRMPPRMNGEKGSRDLRLHPGSIGRVNRSHGCLKFNRYADERIIGGALTAGSSDDAGDEDEDRTGPAGSGDEEGEVSAVESITYRFPSYHEVYNGLVHNILGKSATAAIIDDYSYWEDNGKQASAGKLHVVDYNGCLAETQVQHLFFDGCVRPGDAYCVDVRDLQSGEPVAFSEADGLFVRFVDFYQACTDPEYFVKALEQCESKMTQRALRAQNPTDAGSCLPLSRLELCFSECSEMGDGGLASLAHVLPKTLQALCLNLSCCVKLGDSGLSAVAHGLPPELHELRLDLSRCPNISDEGIAALMRSLPEKLQIFQLDLQRCYGIKDPSIASIRHGLPASLKHLELDVQYTSVSVERKKHCRSLDDLLAWQPPSIDTLLSAPALPAEPLEAVARAAAPARPALLPPENAMSPTGSVRDIQLLEPRPMRMRSTTSVSAMSVDQPMGAASDPAAIEQPPVTAADAAAAVVEVASPVEVSRRSRGPTAEDLSAVEISAEPADLHTMNQNKRGWKAALAGVRLKKISHKEEVTRIPSLQRHAGSPEGRTPSPKLVRRNSLTNLAMHRVDTGSLRLCSSNELHDGEVMNGDQKLPGLPQGPQAMASMRLWHCTPRFAEVRARASPNSPSPPVAFRHSPSPAPLGEPQTLPTAQRVPPLQGLVPLSARARVGATNTNILLPAVSTARWPSNRNAATFARAAFSARLPLRDRDRDRDRDHGGGSQPGAAARGEGAAEKACPLVEPSVSSGTVVTLPPL